METSSSSSTTLGAGSSAETTTTHPSTSSKDSRSHTQQQGKGESRRSRSRSRSRSKSRERDGGGGGNKDTKRTDDDDRTNKHSGARVASPPRGRSRSRSRSYSSRSYSRSRSRSRSRSNDRYRRGGGGGGGGGGRRSRSRSNDRYYGGGGRGGGGQQSRGRGRSSAPPSMTREERELLDLTRDARTVFVSQLVVRTTERDVEDYFEQVGRVEKVSLITDKRTNRCKGSAYVEFADIDDVAHALLLNGQRFCMKHAGCVCSGFPIVVKPSEAEKNYAAAAEAAGGSTLTPGAEKRVYMSNLPPTASEGDMKMLAEILGQVEKVTLLRNGRQASLCCGFVNFANVDAANKAVVQLHKVNMGGFELKVGKLNNVGVIVAHTGETYPLPVGRGGGGGGGANASSGLSAQARATLMAQLSSATTAAAHQLGAVVTGASGFSTAVTGTTLQAPPLPPPLPPMPATTPLLPPPPFRAPSSSSSSSSMYVFGTPSPFLVFEHMFDLQKELASLGITSIPASANAPPAFVAEIKEDTVQVCEEHGRVLHGPLVDITTTTTPAIGGGGGRVFVHMAEIGAAIGVARAFGGLKSDAGTIVARFVSAEEYRKGVETAV